MEKCYILYITNDEMVSETFGSYLKQLRLAKGLGLRTFATKLGVFPSNLSDIEHNKKPAPKDTQRLAQICAVLGIQRNSDEWNKLHDLSVKESPERIPPDLVQYASENAEVVPMLLRTTARRKLTKEEILGLLDRIKKHL